MPPAVLVINAGSSSLKYAVLDVSDSRTVLSGLVERLDPADGGHAAALRHAFDEVEQAGLRDELRGVGHRVVHGGSRFSASVRIDDDVLDGIRTCVRLAPLHNPANLQGIEAARALLPGLAHVAVFDTAFHATLPPRAYRYAVPGDWYAQHDVRRYGFHGTSHRYVAEEAARLLGRPLAELRMITAHLGNGCSLAAIRDGLSVDTSMGMTPLEGLVMGTRSGDVDPGMLAYVAGETGADASAVTQALNSRSGLLGLSGLSNDYRTVEQAAAGGNADAALALGVFGYRLAKYIAAYVVPLGHLDALVFTGGIGENSVTARRGVLEQLGFLGLAEDPALNAAAGRSTDGRITADGGTVALVVPTNEELAIARDAAAVISDG